MTHPYSYEAYLSLPPGYLTELKQELLTEIALYGRRTCERIMRDYNYRRRHHGLNMRDPNTLRPRIIELKQAGVLMEVGETKTPSNRRAALIDISPHWREHLLQTKLPTTQ